MVDRAALEMRSTGNRTGGSNPSLSAIFGSRAHGRFAGAALAPGRLAPGALIEAGRDVSLSPTATLGVSYNGEIASDVEDHGVSGRLDWRF